MAVLGGLRFIALSAGRYHTCGVTPEGVAYCWGSSAGDPAVVGGDLHFAVLSVGDDDHTCGVTLTGAAYRWGYNAAGQLRDWTTIARTSPGAVTGGLTFTGVSTAGGHTCGVTSGGAAYCWGGNSYGELGDGTDSTRPNPVPVKGGLTFALVRAGAVHTCGITTAGAAYCWGMNFGGEIGDGTSGIFYRRSPVPVAGGLTFAALSVGDHHACGITTAGTTYCWGYNSVGQLGDGTTIERTSPVAGGGGLRFAAVSAGEQHTCGVTPAGAVYCWGGWLDFGHDTYRTSPVRVGS